MREQVQKVLAETGAAMQAAWDRAVEALKANDASGEANALMYLNGIGFRPSDTVHGKALAAAMLAKGWNRSTDGMVVRTMPVAPGPSDGWDAVLSPELREFRRAMLAELFERHLSVKHATGEHDARLRIDVLSAVAPWSVAGAFPDGDALRAAYFDAETLAVREAIVKEGESP